MNNTQEVAAAEEWPLTPNWWLHIQSHRGEGDFSTFDFIKITAEAEHGEHKKEIASIMVPAIDGFVCQSHSFPAHVIYQNIKALIKENESLKLQREMLTSDHRTKTLLCKYAALNEEDRNKIDNLMVALSAINAEAANNKEGAGDGEKTNPICKGLAYVQQTIIRG